MQQNELSSEPKTVIDLSSSTSDLDLNSVRTATGAGLSIRRIAAIEGTIPPADASEPSSVPAVSDDELPTVPFDSAHHRSVARGHADAAKMAYLAGNFEEAATNLSKALLIFRQLDDLGNAAWGLNNSGKIQYRMGDLSAARTSLEESVSLFRMTQDVYGLAWSLYNLGRTTYRVNKHDGAKSAIEESLGNFRKWGDRAGVAWALNALGKIAYRCKDYDGARAA